MRTGGGVSTMAGENTSGIGTVAGGTNTPFSTLAPAAGCAAGACALSDPTRLSPTARSKSHRRLLREVCTSSICRFNFSHSVLQPQACCVASEGYTMPGGGGGITGGTRGGGGGIIGGPGMIGGGGGGGRGANLGGNIARSGEERYIE